MLRIAPTIDYEIHGNGDGCPMRLMVEPTARLLRLLDTYGARLTIMADVAEILRFGEHKEATGRDDYHYDAIVDQLRHAVATGHDVQLHIHSSYFNATLEDGSWKQDWSEYNFAELPFARMDGMVRAGKTFLETLLRPVRPTYACVAFRAANWSVSPSTNVVRALKKNGLRIDSSVFKHGRRDGLVTFDYSHAVSPLVPWRAAESDICRVDCDSSLLEIPIYSEKRWIGAFLTAGRIHRVLAGLPHRAGFRGPRGHVSPPSSSDRGSRSTSMLRTALRRHAWKADFNQCDGRQLIAALRRAWRRYAPAPDIQLPFVLIGHSKLFTRANEAQFRPFLSHAAERPDAYGFDTLSAFDLVQPEAIRSGPQRAAA